MHTYIHVDTYECMYLCLNLCICTYLTMKDDTGEKSVNQSIHCIQHFFHKIINKMMAFINILKVR